MRITTPIERLIYAQAELVQFGAKCDGEISRIRRLREQRISGEAGRSIIETYWSLFREVDALTDRTLPLMATAGLPESMLLEMFGYLSRMRAVQMFLGQEIKIMARWFMSAVAKTDPAGANKIARALQRVQLNGETVNLSE